MIMKTALTALFVFIIFNLYAQNINNYSFNNSLIFTNPAFAGSNGGLRVQSNYILSTQPFNYDKNLRYNSVDGYISKLKMGVFVSENGYNSEFSNINTQLSTGISKKISLKNGLTFVPAISGTYLNGNNKYFYGWCATPPVTLYNVNCSEITANSGLIISYKNFYGGISFNNMFSEKYKNKLYFLKEQTNAHLAYTFKINNKNLIQLNAALFVQNYYQSAQVGANAIIQNHFLIGFGYNNSNEIINSIGFKTNIFSVKYNLNYGTSKLSETNYYLHSISASLNLKPKNNKINLKLFEEF